MSDKETLNFNMEKKVLIDLDKMGEIKDTYEYVKEDKTELQRRRRLEIAFRGRFGTFRFGFDK